MKKLLQLILSFLLLGCSSQVKLNEQQFTEKFLQTIAKQYPQRSFEISEPLVITAKFEDNELIHNLTNAFKEYTLTPNELDEIIERYINSAGSIYEQQDGIK